MTGASRFSYMLGVRERVTVTVLKAVRFLASYQGHDSSTHVGAGVTVASMKLEQSAERDAKGSSPSRVPVTARLQLLPWHSPRTSRTAALETEKRERVTASFMMTARRRDFG